MEKTIDYELKRGDLTRLIREMEVGDVLRFPIARHDAVRDRVSNGMLVERSEGARWTVNSDLPNKQSVVTRLS